MSLDFRTLWRSGLNDIVNGNLSSVTVRRQPRMAHNQRWWRGQTQTMSSLNDCRTAEVVGAVRRRYTLQTLVSFCRRVNWKRHAKSWNLTLIDETGSVFSNHASKPPIAHSQFRRAIRAVSIKGVIMGRWQWIIVHKMQAGTNQMLSVAHICHKALSVFQKFHRNWQAAGFLCLPGPETANNCFVQYQNHIECFYRTKMNKSTKIS